MQNCFSMDITTINPFEYWTAPYRLRLRQAQELHELIPIGIDVVRAMPKPRIMICGAITTGNRSIEENIAIFKATILWHIHGGHYVFNQFLFEDLMKRHVEDWAKHSPGQYCNPILDVYAKIFETREIEIFPFIPGWEKSKGATFERNVIKKLGLTYCDLNEDFLDQIQPFMNHPWIKDPATVESELARV
jgi:hypothetical protein